MSDLGPSPNLVLTSSIIYPMVEAVLWGIVVKGSGQHELEA